MKNEIARLLIKIKELELAEQMVKKIYEEKFLKGSLTPETENYIEEIMADSIFDDFESMVKKLAKNGDEIKNSLNADKCHLLHMAIGLSGEAAELFEASMAPEREWLAEELGDMEFYLEGLRAAVFIDSSLPATPPPIKGRSLNHERLSQSAGVLVVISGVILDIVKKHVIYEKDLDIERLKKDVFSLEREMANYAFLINYSMLDVKKKNMAKLSIRFNSGKYSNQHAQEREDKK